MKRKSMLTILLVCTCAMLAACGDKAQEQATPKETEVQVEAPAELAEPAETAEEVASEEDTVQTTGQVFESEKNRVYLDGDSGEGPDVNNYYDQMYKLELLDETNCIYTDIAEYPYGTTTTYTYNGTYTTTANGYKVFTGNSATDAFLIEMKGNVIVSSSYSWEDGDNSKSEIVGVYTGEDAEYGKLTLEIQEGSDIVMKSDQGNVFTGTISVVNGDWDFMATDETSGDYIDWYIYFNGNTFTHDSYIHALYCEYEGAYEMVGDLGTLVLNVNDMGNASCEVELNGEKRLVSGSINVDSDIHQITGCYLSDDNGYGMELYIQRLDEGILNYSGNYFVPLNAG